MAQREVRRSRRLCAVDHFALLDSAATLANITHLDKILARLLWLQVVDLVGGLLWWRGEAARDALL